MVTENVVLLISSTFRYTTLYERIERYTARIDYNQDFYIYICCSYGGSYKEKLLMCLMELKRKGK